MTFSICFFIFATLSISNGSEFSSRLCLDCLKNTTKTVVNLEHVKQTIEKPSVVCKDDNSLTFLWNVSKTLDYYLIKYALNESTESKFSYQFTRCNHFTLKNLAAATNYKVKLLGLNFRKKHIQKSGMFTVQTKKKLKNLELLPVKKLNYNLSFNGQDYDATVQWEPSIDLSCYYEIIWHENQKPGDHIYREFNVKNYLKNEFVLNGLELGKIYHFAITTIDKTGRPESKKKRLKISIPTCMETFRNVSMCLPNKPENLTGKGYLHGDNSTLMDLLLNWAKAEYNPDYYTVNFVSSDKYGNSSLRINFNITGDQEQCTIKNITKNHYYMIKLTAFSLAGPSISAYLKPTQVLITEELAQDIKSSNKTESFIKWFSVIVFTTFILVVVLYFRHKLKQWILKHFFIKDIENSMVRYTTTPVEDSKWELAETKLILDKVVGFGAFGIVQKGYYHLESNQKTPVAIKTLKAKPSGEQIAQFYAEIEIMKSVPYHNHIVHLIGVITKHRISNPLMLVEYCPGGDLQTFLRKIKVIVPDMKSGAVGRSFDGTTFSNMAYDLESPNAGLEKGRYALEVKDLLSFARQIVVGMDFLSKLKVVHRDLASRNVLIGENNILKISDFGLSRDIYTNNVYRKFTGGKLPFKWMALESLTHQVYTTESDVWSFGIVLWEIVTLGGNPYPTVPTEDLMGLLKGGYRMERPENCSQELYDIMLSCWQISPNLRPSFKELRDNFDRLLETQIEYISFNGTKNIQEEPYENFISTLA
ncbi:hypothetical protein ABEB36_012179 [Hypothenemus hampei]|uniref:receptor protein-tyrosine kinase n=1 Tax=Hypothenemus hampei TaxID=57062 RepID=A0ABD1EAB2_HYPHA